MFLLASTQIGEGGDDVPRIVAPDAPVLESPIPTGNELQLVGVQFPIHNGGSELTHLLLFGGETASENLLIEIPIADCADGILLEGDAGATYFYRAKFRNAANLLSLFSNEISISKE